MAKKKKRVQKKKFLKPDRQRTGKNLNPPFSVLVTGFARTGTSTLMRMLYLGGLDVICDLDKMKGAHQFDPYGNFEMDAPLYHIGQHGKGWTKGSAVKVVCPYVVTKPGLPMDRPWKAIFMLRPIPEILASLAALKVVWEYEPADAIRDCKRYLDEHEVDVCYVQYSEMIQSPLGTSEKLANFLGIPELDVKRMATAVSKTPREDYKGDKIIRAPREVINYGAI